jgi:hypothetical protein
MERAAGGSRSEPANGLNWPTAQAEAFKQGFTFSKDRSRCTLVQQDKIHYYFGLKVYKNINRRRAEEGKPTGVDLLSKQHANQPSNPRKEKGLTTQETATWFNRD